MYLCNAEKTLLTVGHSQIGLTQDHKSRRIKRRDVIDSSGWLGKEDPLVPKAIVVPPYMLLRGIYIVQTAVVVCQHFTGHLNNIRCMILLNSLGDCKYI